MLSQIFRPHTRTHSIIACKYFRPHLIINRGEHNKNFIQKYPSELAVECVCVCIHNDIAYTQATVVGWWLLSLSWVTFKVIIIFVHCTQPLVVYKIYTVNYWDRARLHRQGLDDDSTVSLCSRDCVAKYFSPKMKGADRVRIYLRNSPCVCVEHLWRVFPCSLFNVTCDLSFWDI